MRPSLLAASVSLAAWVGLVAARGGFWRSPADGQLGASRGVDLSGVRVEAVVPARDEAAVVGRSVASLVAQRFAGSLAVTLVDDSSSDGTADVARAAVAGAPVASRLTVVPGRPPPPGWTGKLSALHGGIEHVLDRRGPPDYWLLTDADIEHDASNVADLVAHARRYDLAIASLMVRLACETRWEKLLVPAFVFFFAKLYPFAWVNDDAAPTAAAAGGCILLSHAAYERMGGLAAVRGALIDDCAIAGAVKGSGGRVRLYLTAHTRSIRPYEGLRPLWAMVKRSAFVQLGESYPLLAATVAAMAALYLVPPAAALAGGLRRDAPLATVGAAATALMAFAYLPTLRLYGRRPAEALALPAAAALYTAMTVDSGIASALGRRGDWKGRTYAEPVAEIVAR